MSTPEYQKQRRDALRAKGLCISCGKWPAQNGRAKCRGCLSKQLSCTVRKRPYRRGPSQSSVNSVVAEIVATVRRMSERCEKLAAMLPKETNGR